MIFIFPRNYNYKSKFLGFIDYFSLTINIIYTLFIICLSNLIFTSLNIKIFTCVSLCLPLLILSIVGLNNENIFLVLLYLFNYFKKPQLYLYNKQ